MTIVSDSAIHHVAPLGATTRSEVAESITNALASIMLMNDFPTLISDGPDAQMLEHCHTCKLSITHTHIYRYTCDHNGTHTHACSITLSVFDSSGPHL